MKEMLDNKIAVIPLFDPDKSKGGIWIPDEAKERCDQGIVKYCGPKCEFISPGDFVLFPGYTGQSIRDDEDGVLIIFRETDAVAKIVGDEFDSTDVPGLYFRGKDGDYFQANVEYALILIAQALQEEPWRQRIKSKDMKDHRPAAESRTSRGR